MPLVLVSNDDGIAAAGLPPLEEALAPLGEVWVVAPEVEQSARSHALTMHKPLRVREHAPRRFAVSGTPADCVYMALHRLLPERPALVVSGINRGSNLGNDILYSGTVAAAMEGCLAGVPSMAVSLHVEQKPRHWDTAASVAGRLAADLLGRGLPRRSLLNVNVPDRPERELAGIAVCALGERIYHVMVDERRDPRGHPYYWIGGPHERFGEGDRHDGPMLLGGWVTVTPVSADMTDHAGLAHVRSFPSVGA